MLFAKSQEFEEKNISVDGLSINYKIAGLGPAVLVLHGWGKGSDGYLGILNGLLRKYKVYIPDMPGFGKSTAPATAWGVDEYAQFVLHFADITGLQSFILFGHSFGGQVASGVALLQPSRIQKLILCGAAVIRKNPTMKKKMLWLFAKMGNSFFSMWPFSLLQDIAGKAFYRLVGTKDWRYSQGIMKEVRKRVLLQDFSSLVSGIRVPTLIVWGDQDKATPIRDAYILKERIPNSTLEVIPGTGHRLYAEQPEKFFEIILKFLSL